MSDLPSFLTQTGPSSYTLTFSASAAETFMLCPAKYSWSRITGIEAAAARAGMNYGKALHLALAHRYSRMDLSLAQAEEQAEAIFREHFATHPQPEMGTRGRPEWRTPARAMQAFRAYNAQYPAEDFEVLGVEEPFEVELGVFDAAFAPAQSQMPGYVRHGKVTVTVKFRGLRDLRVRWHDAIWVLDHKTSTEWSDLVVDEGKASFQFQGYGWVERDAQNIKGELAHNEAVGGVIGNYLISRENYANESRKPTPRDLPRDQFVRQPYPYSDAELDEWHQDAMDVAREIFERWQAENWPRRRTACAHWGRCEYYRLCWETDPAYRLSAAMSADYQPRTPSPFEDAENGKERV